MIVNLPNPVDISKRRVRRNSQTDKRKGNVRGFDVPQKKAETLSGQLPVKLFVKTAIDAMGKELKSEWKAKCDAIDLERRKIWDELESLQATVCQPLTDFENKEKNALLATRKSLLFS